MKTILVINNASPEAGHAARFALSIAQKMQANLLLANITRVLSTVKVLTDGSLALGTDDSLLENLETLNTGNEGFKPEISELDASSLNESQLAEYIYKKDISMIVKGELDGLQSQLPRRDINIHTVLNKVRCPLLLVPANWHIKDVERMAYISDLRYCRSYIISQMARVAKPWGASISVAHISVDGLPDMEESYALSVFKAATSNIQYEKLFFNNIREKELLTAVDVLINGMHNDLLVLINHRYHFEEIIGRYITDTLPHNVTVPLLIYPY
jgi:hypothetical protein